MSLFNKIATELGRNDGSIFDKYGKLKSLENRTRASLDRKRQQGIKASTKNGFDSEKYNADIQTLENRLQYAKDQQNAIARPQEDKVWKANTAYANEMENDAMDEARNIQMLFDDGSISGDDMMRFYSKYPDNVDDIDAIFDSPAERRTLLRNFPKKYMRHIGRR